MLKDLNEKGKTVAENGKKNTKSYTTNRQYPLIGAKEIGFGIGTYTVPTQ